MKIPYLNAAQYDDSKEVLHDYVRTQSCRYRFSDGPMTSQCKKNIFQRVHLDSNDKIISNLEINGTFHQFCSLFLPIVREN